MRLLLIALMLAVAVACHSAPQSLGPDRCSGQTVDASTVLPVAEAPKPLELFTPPLPIPTDVFHHRSMIRVVVDTLGRVMRDSTLVCGIPDARFARRLADAAAEVRFRPRLTTSGLVIAPALLIYDF